MFNHRLCTRGLHRLSFVFECSWLACTLWQSGPQPADPGSKEPRTPRANHGSSKPCQTHSSHCQTALCFTKENNKNQIFCVIPWDLFCSAGISALGGKLNTCPVPVSETNCIRTSVSLLEAPSLMNYSWDSGLVLCSVKSIHHCGLTLITHNIRTAKRQSEWHWSWLQYNVLVEILEFWHSCQCSLTRKPTQVILETVSTLLVNSAPWIEVLQARHA